MPTRQYFRDTASAITTPTAEQATAFPVGTNNSNAFARKTLSLTKGTSQVALTKATLAQSTQQSGLLAAFVSDVMTAQTVPAGDWTIAFANSETNANANVYHYGIVYVWRPGTASKVITLYDTTNAMSASEASTGETGLVNTAWFSTTSFTVQAGDVIVVEIWYACTQGMSTAYSQSFYYDGATAPTNLTATTDAASYIEFSGTIGLGGPQTYNVNVAGGVTPAGANGKQTTKPTTGGITPSSPTIPVNSGPSTTVSGETFARASSASYRDSTGGVSTVGSNVKRTASYAPGDSTPRLLLEPARTNNNTYSEDLTNAAYTKDSCTIAGGDTGPGGETIKAITPNNGATAARVYTAAFNGAIDPNPGAMSFVAKPNGFNWLRILTNTTGANGILTSHVNVATGALGTIDAQHIVYTEALKNGYYRVTVIVKAGNGSVGYMQWYPASADNTLATGDGTSGVYVGEIQFEIVGANNPIASTSYISNNGAGTTSRAADEYSIPFTLSPRLMTIYVKYRERGTGVSGATAGLLAIGTPPHATPLLALVNGGAGIYLYHHNGVSSISAAPGITPVIGDIVEVRGVLLANGGVRCGVTINGGTETVASDPSTLTLAASWAAQLLTLSNYAGYYGAAGYECVKVVEGELSLAEMRAATSGLVMLKLRQMTLSGAATSAGVMARVAVFARVLSGTVASVGAIIRASTRKFAGAVASAGGTVRRLSRNLAGAITSAGVVTRVRQFSRTVSGGVASVGVIVRAVIKVPSGAVASAGVIARAVSHKLAGSVPSAGVALRSLSRNLAGSVASVGAVIRQALRALGGTVASSGVIVRAVRYARALSGAIATLVGALALTFKPGTQLMSGTVGSSGGITRSTTKPVLGNVASVGALVRRLSRALAAAIASSGVVVAAGRYARAVAGTIASTGVAIRQPRKSPSGGVASAGVVVRSSVFTRVIAGNVASVGAIVRLTAHKATGAIASAGVVVGTLRKIMQAALTPVGVLSLTSKALVSLAGNITPIGGVSRRLSRAILAAVASNGALVRATSFVRSLAGAITPNGALGKSMLRQFVAAVASSGALTRKLARSLVATVSPNGALARLSQRYFAGTVANAGLLVRAVSVPLSAVIGSVGAVARAVRKTLAGGVTPSGLFGRLFPQALSGLINSDGDLRPGVSVQADGAIQPTGAIRKSINVVGALGGTVAAAGQFAILLLTRALRATIKPVGRLGKWNTRLGTGRIRSVWIPTEAIHAIAASGARIRAVFASGSRTRDEE